VVATAHLADQFLDAWTHKQFERARSLLHDDLSFTGPIDTFSNADTYLASLRQLSDIVTGTERHKAFVDGDEACIIYDLHTTAVPTARVCEWFRIRDGKIASISAVFDARPFAAMFGGGHGP
jgi:SnoaL-like domain